jgi:general secretion pathway protein A
MPTIFSFFGLRENPFKINPDPRFLFVTDQARATSDELVYAIRTRKGLILLTGEVGTGKTMLLRRLLDWLAEQKMPTALIFNSHINPDHLLDFILNDFGVPCASTLKSEKLMALNCWLLERYRAGQTPVLLVDEAQGLDATALEEIRLLLNFETPREKLLQIVLAGQPELEIKLKRHELRQLRQRITIRCRTAPLTLEQTHGYIRERLRIAGADGRNPIFERDAVGSIHAYSHGIPRVINVLCEHSLVNACAEGASTVSAGAVEQAARECQLDRVDSVARILNTSSYSTASLSDINSLLAAISASSDSATEPVREAQESEVPRPPSANPSQPAYANSVPERISGAAIAKNVLEEVAVKTEAPVPYIQELPPEPQTFPIQTGTTSVRTAPAPSLSRFLRIFGASFVADARATARQVRRAIHSFELRHWDPFVRTLGHEMRKLLMQAAHISSDPRWKQLRTQFAGASQASCRRFKSAMPSWLAERFGIGQQETHKQVHTGSPRVNRQRAMLYLRRWLHEPLSTQRKRSQTRRTAQ